MELSFGMVLRTFYHGVRNAIGPEAAQRLDSYILAAAESADVTPLEATCLRLLREPDDHLTEPGAIQ
jgi:hypothetical protein